MKPS
jgi:hypothetical protein